MALSKDEIDRIMRIDCLSRGSTFQTDQSYVLRHYGEAGLEKVNQILAGWGHPIDYKAMKSMQWYPTGLRILSLMALKEAFNLTLDQIKQVGMEASPHSFVVRLLINLFISIEMMLKACAVFYSRSSSKGKFEVVSIDSEKKISITALKGNDIDPLACKFYEGYIMGLGTIIGKKIVCTETKCTFRGDPYHEFTITWD